MNNAWRIEWIFNKQSNNLFLVAAAIKNGTKYYPVGDASETYTNTTRGILRVPYTGTFIIRVITSSDTEWTLYIEELKPAIEGTGFASAKVWRARRDLNPRSSAPKADALILAGLRAHQQQ